METQIIEKAIQGLGVGAPIAWLAWFLLKNHMRMHDEDRKAWEQDRQAIREYLQGKKGGS